MNVAGRSAVNTLAQRASYEFDGAATRVIELMTRCSGLIPSEQQQVAVVDFADRARIDNARIGKVLKLWECSDSGVLRGLQLFDTYICQYQIFGEHKPMESFDGLTSSRRQRM